MEGKRGTGGEKRKAEREDKWRGMEDSWKGL